MVFSVFYFAPLAILIKKRSKWNLRFSVPSAAFLHRLPTDSRPPPWAPPTSPKEPGPTPPKSPRHQPVPPISASMGNLTLLPKSTGNKPKKF